MAALKENVKKITQKTAKENVKKISLPLTDAVIEALRAGDSVLITGVLFTARDTAHKRLFEALKKGEFLPVDLKGQIFYYAGPTPARPGKPIGSIGPTTSYRMDPYTPLLIENGLKGMIGKGSRSDAVIQAMMKFKAVYFGAIGGAAALMARSVKKAETVAFEELGPEAIVRLTVEDFPAVVVNDCRGGDLYREGREKYRI